MLIAMLEHGSSELNINSGRYHLVREFLPPELAETVLYASGTWANRSGGAVAIDKRAENRTWTIPIDFEVGSAMEAARAAGDLQDFLSRAGDSEPLYITIYPDKIGPNPLWGQHNAGRRYEILHGTLKLGRFPISPTGVITIVVKPYALGGKQRLTSALGGIYENLLGSLDGKSRGLRIDEATTNKMTNPTFGHATWNTGWTAGANIVATQNTDLGFCFPGMLASAKLTARNTTLNTYTQSINVGNANKHSLTAYIMLPDGGTPDANDCQIYYGSAQTTVFTHLGNNVYRACTSNINGLNAATATGLVVKNGRTVILLGMQIEEKTYCTPLCHGDLLGCAWTGTAWASTSSRTAGRVRLDVAEDTFSLAQGSIRIIWRPWVEETHGTNQFLFSCGAASLRAYYNATDDKFYLTDNANTISSAAQTWTAFEDEIELEFAWGPGRLEIVKNGISAASGATYSPPALPSYIYIGSDDSAANQLQGEILGVSIFDQDRAVADILSDYTNHKPILDNGQRLETVPWLWTKDGDNVVDNCYDATHTNWAVCGGIPGTAETQPEFSLGLTNFFLDNVLWLSSVPLDNMGSISSNFWKDFSGTVTAGALGGQTENQTIVLIPGSVEFSLAPTNPRILYGSEVYILARVAFSAGATPNVRARVDGFGAIISTALVAISSSTNLSLYLFGPLPIPEKKALLGNTASNITLTVKFSDTNGTIVKMDYLTVLPRPLLKFGLIETAGAQVDVNGRLFARYGVFESKATGAITQTADISGDEIMLLPDRYNVLLNIIGDVPSAGTITLAMTYSRVFITPRWSLL